MPIWTSSMLFALTAWSIPVLVAALSGDLFGLRLAPAALGLMTVIFGLGQALGPWMAGWLADRTGSFSAGLLLAGAVALAGALGTLFLDAPSSGRAHGASRQDSCLRERRS